MPSILQEYLRRTAKSGKLAKTAKEVLPDGISTDTRRFEPYGVYVDRAKGVTKWDVDGNEYLVERFRAGFSEGKSLICWVGSGRRSNSTGPTLNQ